MQHVDLMVTQVEEEVEVLENQKQQEHLGQLLH
jgi:hypothetical protein